MLGGQCAVYKYICEYNQIYYMNGEHGAIPLWLVRLTQFSFHINQYMRRHTRTPTNTRQGYTCSHPQTIPTIPFCTMKINIKKHKFWFIAGSDCSLSLWVILRHQYKVRFGGSILLFHFGKCLLNIISFLYAVLTAQLNAKVWYNYRHSLCRWCCNKCLY